MNKVDRVGTPSERFWRKVLKTDTCWLWLGAIQSGGYGNIRINKKSVKSHRFAYEELVGEIPKGMVIDHLCRNRRCVNPSHMEVVTFEENVKRGYKYRKPIRNEAGRFTTWEVD